MSHLSLAVAGVEAGPVRHQFADHYVLTVETGDVQTRVAVAVDHVKFYGHLKEQLDHIDLTAGRGRVQGSVHLGIDNVTNG